MDKFESSVILEGSKTQQAAWNGYERFESSVILEGSKTNPDPDDPGGGLRVVLF